MPREPIQYDEPLLADARDFPGTPAAGSAFGARELGSLGVAARHIRVAAAKEQAVLAAVAIGAVGMLAGWLALGWMKLGSRLCEAVAVVVNCAVPFP